jgi:hypothetical protein
MVIKDIKNYRSKGFQNVPKLEVRFENKPFGNPDPTMAESIDTVLGIEIGIV